MQISNLPKVTDKGVDLAINAVKKARINLPETTCRSCATCCSAGFPNCAFSEFLQIYRDNVLKMSREERLNLTLECVKRYITSQSPDAPKKPCAFLSKETNLCSVYESRPTKCRTYGIIPHNLYKRIVNQVSIDTGVPERYIPLCVQCPYVQIKPEFANKFPNGTIPEEMIREIETELKAIDNTLLGVTTEAQEQGFGFLAYHDWHLIFEMGVTWLEKLTPIRLKFSQEEKDKFIVSLKNVLQSQLLDKKEDLKNEHNSTTVTT